MNKTVLETLEADFQYRGNYSTPALDLIPQAISLIKNSMRRLSPFGLQLRGLRIDGATIPDTALNFSIPDLSFTARTLLDHIEVNVWKLHEVGAEAAAKLLLATWNSIHETDATIEISSHVVWLNFYARPVGSSYHELMERFTIVPAGLAERETRAGVGFYFPADTANGRQAGSLVLDRWLGPEDGIALKLTLNFNATVQLEQIAERTEEHLRWLINQLDIEFKSVK